MFRAVRPVLRIRDVYPGSRILIFTHPGSRIPDLGSRIPDPKTVTKERGEKNLLAYFFCSHKFHKIKYYVIFEILKKKIWANFQRIVEVFTQKTFNMLSNIWVWDPGSEIRDPGKTYSGSRIQGSKRHRIPDPGSGSATLRATVILSKKTLEILQFERRKNMFCFARCSRLLLIILKHILNLTFKQCCGSGSAFMLAGWIRIQDFNLT
jgi:hypothetical protein